MTTVSEELMAEGTEVLASHNAEDIHRLGDRILSVEPDNWYGLYIRGVADALEIGFADAVTNWSKCLANMDEDADVTPLLGDMVSSMAFCLTHMKGGEVKDFSSLGQLISDINQKLPESDEEVIVNPILDEIAAFVRDHDAENPFTAYYAAKALAMTSFRAYVELRFFVGFFTKVKDIGGILKAKCDQRVGNAIDTDAIFVDEVIRVMEEAIANTPAETMEAIEEYWLEHNIDTYLGHLAQAYQMSLAMATAGKFVSKMAKKVMNAEIPLFIKNYLAAKI